MPAFQAGDKSSILLRRTNMNTIDDEYKEKLEVLRQKIFEVDKKLIGVIKERDEFVKEVGELKKEKGIPPLDMVQWQKVLTTRKEIGKELGVDENIIEEVWNTLHKIALNLEK